jgi:hypothetical protein
MQTDTSGDRYGVRYVDMRRRIHEDMRRRKLYENADR